MFAVKYLQQLTFSTQKMEVSKVSQKDESVSCVCGQKALCWFVCLCLCHLAGVEMSSGYRGRVPFFVYLPDAL